jgi:CBS domain-containing protein
MMLVKDVMSPHVVLATPDTPFKDLARLLETSQVTALPVVDGASRVLGIVSESDLLPKAEKRSDDAYLLENRSHRQQRTKAGGQIAEQLMTRPVLTIRPDVPVALAARLMHEHDVKQLPVIDGDGRLCGIVGRGDLIKVFLRSDQAIKEEVEEVLGARGDAVRVEVVNGVVKLAGAVRHRSSIAVSVRLARGVDGVVGVQEELGFEKDDTPWTSGLIPTV